MYKRQVWDFSLELIDINGNAKGWFRQGPSNVWDDLWIAPSGGLQAPFDTLLIDPAFDIHQVVAIRFDESGMWTQPFPIDPTTGGGGGGWNAWASFSVDIPEPTTLSLLGLSLIGLGLAAGRRRREAKTDD